MITLLQYIPGKAGDGYRSLFSLAFEKEVCQKVPLWIFHIPLCEVWLLKSFAALPWKQANSQAERPLYCKSGQHCVQCTPLTMQKAGFFSSLLASLHVANIFVRLKQHVQGKRQNWVKDLQLCFLRCQFWMVRIHQSKKGTNSEIIKLWRDSPINIENCIGKLMVQAEFQTHHFNFWVQAKWFPSFRLLWRFLRASRSI